jgi:hypothetical protein
MTMEIVYFIGALILLTALIYGTLEPPPPAQAPEQGREPKSFVIDMSKPDWRPE